MRILGLFKMGFTRFPVLVIMFSFCPGYSNGLDLLEECKKTEDGHVTRGNFTCCASDHLPLQPSLDFQTGWRKCAVEPESLNEDPVISAWRVYRCIVFQGLSGKPLLPSTFTSFMAARYPAVIKAKIFQKLTELEKENMKFELDVECLKRTPYPKIHLLRNLFYDTEQAICEGNETFGQNNDYNSASRSRPSMRAYELSKRSVASWTSSDLAENLCETCDRHKAMYHRNGDCCSHVPIPFSFFFLPYRYGNDDRVNQCAEDLVDDVGLPGDTEFSSHLQYLCYSSCEYYLSGVLEETDLWTGVDLLQSQGEIRSLVMKMMPKYLSSKYKQNIIHFVLENFRAAWAETKTFESRIKLSQLDIRNYDKKKLKNLLASCRTHRLIETIATLYLNNLCLDLYPLRDSNATTAKSPTTPQFPYSNTTTPTSSAVSNDDVTLTFDWGTPNRNKGNRPFHHNHQQHKYEDDDDDMTNSYGPSLPWDFERNISGSKWSWSSTTPAARRQYIRVF